MFRSRFERLAFRLRIAAENAPEPPLDDNSMELAMYLNCGVAVVGFIALLIAGAPAWASLVFAVVTFVSLSVALFHRHARWLSVLLGTALAASVAGALGSLSPPSRSA